ncbi:class I SAM-dependent methyltransferase [Crateriforma spongiae]|uniref:class I SAM-dependent methyltransferase n=1 Tax=Crateriforma spongiae TaxID=2724528 RepID=UPI0014455686|nr:class I SAM-dependent methyltransferase [Crateriforma spongiae]
MISDIQSKPHPKRPSSDSRDRKTSNKPASSPLYHQLVPAYEALWPAVSKRRIAENIAALDIAPATQVLEVGVGTGLSLDTYPHHIELTGVDLSVPMLAEAQERIDKNDWQHIRVMPMNAESLDFEDDSFDLVTSFHTVSVVNDPQAMMREMVRVCRPGGQILLINHFRSKNPLIAAVVDSAGNLTKHLGWRTDLRLDPLLDQLPIRLEDRFKPKPWSLFTVLRATCKVDRMESAVDCND